MVLFYSLSNSHIIYSTTRVYVCVLWPRESDPNTTRGGSVMICSFLFLKGVGLGLGIIFESMVLMHVLSCHVSHSFLLFVHPTQSKAAETTMRRQLTFWLRSLAFWKWFGFSASQVWVAHLGSYMPCVIRWCAFWCAFEIWVSVYGFVR